MSSEAAAVEVVVVPATADRWDDVAAVFDGPATPVAAGASGASARHAGRV